MNARAFPISCLLYMLAVFLPALSGCEGGGDASSSIADWSARDRLGGLEARRRAPLSAPPGAERTLAIAVTGDLKGWITRGTLFPETDFPKARQRGLAHLSRPLAALRKAHPDLILLDAGDALHGAPSATLFSEEGGALPLKFPILTLMNHLAYDAIALGNFDLGLGWASLAHAQADSDFPWLAGNLWRRGGEPREGAAPERDGTLLAPYRVLERGGVRVAVLGLTTPRAAQGIDPRHLEGLRLGDLAEAARLWVPFLRREEAADLVVGLFHSGLDDEYQREVALRARPPWGPGAGQVADEGLGFDLIVAGDAHRLSPRYSRRRPADHSVPVLEPGAYGNGLALAVFTLAERDGRWAVTALERSTQRAEEQPDSAALAVVEKSLAATRRGLSYPTRLRFRKVPRKGEFYRCAGALSHLAAEFLAGFVPKDRDAKGNDAKNVISLLPMRWRFHPPRKEDLGSPLRRAHLYRWMPYAETLVSARLTGRQIEILLDGHLRHLRGRRVPDLEVFWPGGLRLTPTPSGSEIAELSLDGVEGLLSPSQTHSVWLTAYTWHGGGGLAARALLRPGQRERAVPISLRAGMFALLSNPRFNPPPPCARWLENPG